MILASALGAMQIGCPIDAHASLVALWEHHETLDARSAPLGLSEIMSDVVHGEEATLWRYGVTHDDWIMCFISPDELMSLGVFTGSIEVEDDSASTRIMDMSNDTQQIPEPAPLVLMLPLVVFGVARSCRGK